jgi:hypothetical protein
VLPAVASTTGAAGSEAAVAFGGLDHRQADAVLDRAAGVLRFELQEQRARPGVEARDLDQRRVADQFQDGRLVGDAQAWGSWSASAPKAAADEAW